jgi:hypothetical protein
MTVLQCGNTKARLHAMDILTKISGAGDDWTTGVDVDDVLKYLLKLLSNKGPTRLSPRAHDVLLDIVEQTTTKAGDQAAGAASRRDPPVTKQRRSGSTAGSGGSTPASPPISEIT